MTRNREIELKAEQNTTNQLELEGFIKGAEWADKNPRKGLWDSKKVCEWMRNHLLISQYKILEDLRKAMED